jgi:DNA-binding CsgD family transcriptional regulator
MVATTVAPPIFQELEFDSGRARDYVRMVEHAYDLDADETAWRLNIVHALGSALGESSAITWDYRLAPDYSTNEARNLLFVNAQPGLLEALIGLSLDSDPGQMRRVFNSNFVCSGTEILGALCDSDPRRRYLSPLGIPEFIGLSTPALDGSGLAFQFSRSRPYTFTAPVRYALQRVMIHIAAARRLRARLRSASTEPDAAILDPKGKLLHAEDDAAKQKTPREALTEAVQHIAASRGKLRREKPEQALDLWKGLVRGRWSLIERIDTDGRRFLVARKNDEHAPDPRALTLPERRVAGYAALGHSNKVIAYELGIAPSTVSRLLASALRKLGLKSKVELASMGFRPAKR